MVCVMRLSFWGICVLCPLKAGAYGKRLVYVESPKKLWKNERRGVRAKAL